jgi:putative DNA-invertase from lambdoid prophage Rac
MLATVAETERDIIIKCTWSCLARKKAEGKTFGPPSTAEQQHTSMGRQHWAGEPISALARTFGIFHASVIRVVNPTATIQ